MMLPKVIIHNSVSVDCSIAGFEPDLGLHYGLLEKLKPDMMLVGSDTALAGIRMFHKKLPEETKTDLAKPSGKSGLLWAIPDSGGKLKGLLHVLRQSEYCRDVVVLVSEKTPEDYMDYLRQRDYDFHVAGKDRVDLRSALEMLAKKYKARKIVTDCGATLGNILLSHGLAKHISLLVHPAVAGKQSALLFRDIGVQMRLRLSGQKRYSSGHVWLLYEVVN